MAKDQFDQDALAAEWGLALEADQPGEMSGGDENGTTPWPPNGRPWWKMVGSSISRPKAAPIASSIRTKSTTCSASRCPQCRRRCELTGVQALINSALVSYERLPMLEIVFDRLVRLTTTSLRNFTSDNVEVSLEFDHLGAVRRLSQFHPAAGDPLGHQGRGMGEFRPSDRRFQSHLFDDRRAARRPPGRRRDPGRGPALHHHRDGAGAPHDRGHPR